MELRRRAHLSLASSRGMSASVRMNISGLSRREMSPWYPINIADSSFVGMASSTCEAGHVESVFALGMLYEITNVCHASSAVRRAIQSSHMAPRAQHPTPSHKIQHHTTQHRTRQSAAH